MAIFPQTSIDTRNTSLEPYEASPSNTYKMDFQNKRIVGKVSDQDAYIQFCKKVLDTAKYAYVIYDWYYGNELLDLVGEDFAYIETEAPRIITDALMADERTLGVDEFEFERTGVDSILISCVVQSIYGKFNYTTEVVT